MIIERQKYLKIKITNIINIRVQVKKRLAIKQPLHLTPLEHANSTLDSSLEKETAGNEDEIVRKFGDHAEADFPDAEEVFDQNRWAENNFLKGNFEPEEIAFSNESILMVENILENDVLQSEMQMIFDGNCNIIEKKIYKQVSSHRS